MFKLFQHFFDTRLTGAEIFNFFLNSRVQQFNFKRLIERD